VKPNVYINQFKRAV